MLVLKDLQTNEIYTSDVNNKMDCFWLCYMAYLLHDGFNHTVSMKYIKGE